MYWNGIPFPFVETLTKENIALQITKLPTLIIDSGFPWESLVGAFIAGSIPAYIAWKTIKSNNEVIKRQITLAAQQRKCDELRGLFANYIALQTSLVAYLEMVYDEHGGESENIPFEKVAEMREDFYKLKHCETLVYLLIGTNDPFYEKIFILIESVDYRIEDHFQNYSANSSSELFSLDDDNKKLMILFSEILEREQSKI